MGRTEVSTTKNGKARIVVWEDGVCPYCGSNLVVAFPVSKKVRGCDHLLSGVEYSCGECGSENVFTKR